MKNKAIVIVDVVGAKAGMDLYDLNLATSLQEENVDVSIASNFNSNEVPCKVCFSDVKLHGIKRISNIVYGHLVAFMWARKNKVKNVLMHSFSFEMKDLIPLIISKILGLRVILIVHDVSGFGDRDNNGIRNFILNSLVNNIVVHNKFSRDRLFNDSSKKIKNKTAIIKHGNFTSNEFVKINREEALDQLKLSSEYKYVLFFGQIKKVKGVDVLLNAFEMVSDPKVRLIIAGKPWLDSFEEYESIINEKNLNDRVIKRIQFIENDVRDLLFSACEMLILPYKEIYQSGVLLMALSSKIPVIVSDLIPFKEVIGDDCGIQFENMNHVDLAEKINYAIKHPEELKTNSENGYKNMKFNYSWRTIAQEYYNLI